jgi:uncharacterized protein YyaL (SSP411 family)
MIPLTSPRRTEAPSERTVITMAKRAKPKTTKGNRLGDEKSPYLLQHADNPVDWFPWGEEAFETARREDKPIFLSIGYSTCHWCHVMAHESFEDPAVAKMMNDNFVNIKVDREERPDIDGIYMTVCQMMTGSGGWPLTIVMTPDKSPFFAGTYFPKESRFGRGGMLDMVPQLAKVWRERRDEVNASAEQITAELVKQVASTRGDEMDDRFINTTALQLNQRFDEENGGFGSAPKFPSPHQLTFLLRFWRREADEWSNEMTVRTLKAMRKGGIYDHVGFGFHRYSTDARWLLPHFEKMLYDQAGLLIAYTEAFQATGDIEFRSVAGEIVEYVLRDMTSPEGAFYSAEDADSEGEEGKFYVWTLPQLEEVLGKEDGALAATVWNAKKGGNFHDEASGQASDANVLHLTDEVKETAMSLGMTEDALVQRKEAIRLKLLQGRSTRVRPGLDDKVLTDWNGFMIAALAKAGSALGEPSYIDAAEQAVAFVLKTLKRDEGRLLHRYRDGEAAIAGHLDDHAFLVWGLLELYEATFDARYLEEANSINKAMLDNFWDEEAGGFYLTAADGEELLVRQKETYDGAMPSGNSVAMLNLLRLSHLTGDTDLVKRASEMGATFSAEVGKMPSGYTQMMSALDMALGGGQEVVIVGDPDKEDTVSMLQALRRPFLPDKVVLLKRPGDDQDDIVDLAPFLKDHHQLDGKATAYVCRDHFCNNPTTDVQTMLDVLGA